MGKRLIAILLSVSCLGLTGCNIGANKTNSNDNNPTNIETEDTQNNDTDKNDALPPADKSNETGSTSIPQQIVDIEEPEIIEEETTDYRYNLEKAGQFAKDIQLLNEQVAFYLDQLESGTINGEEFAENVKDLPVAYDQLNIEFLRDTKYYDRMLDGIQDTINGLNWMIISIGNEDGKTLNQSTSQLKRGQMMIIDTLTEMAEDLE